MDKLKELERRVLALEETAVQVGGEAIIIEHLLSTRPKFDLPSVVGRSLRNINHAVSHLRP